MSNNKTDVDFEAGPKEQEITVGESKVHLDNEGNFVGAEAFGNRMEKVDGGMKITRPDGSVMIMHESGISIENFTPKSVGIKDLAEVESYTLRETAEGRVHIVQFVGGGSLEVTYSESGAFKRFSGKKLEQSISVDNEVLISQASETSSLQ